MAFRDEKGRFISEASFNKNLTSKGLTMLDYKRASEHVKRYGKDSPVKETYEFLDRITDVHSLEQSDVDLVKHLSDMPNNRGKAYLNGERVSKMFLAEYITDYAKGIGVPVHFLYLNHEFKGFDTYVNLDGELAELISEADDGEEVEDSHGNKARTKSNNAKDEK